ncbi:ribosome biogenesis GTPase YlqF [Fusobacterium sp. PH5-44]|uniref:ribosome biogenesis GTPase YlqF n=1 Tax=unclassified Fusobacterium TaxID=2648384 RepID=UPI003D198A74
MSMTKINWYPGHMKKTKDLIKENLPLIDIVLEVVDGRVPLSSKNPDISKITATKKRIIVINKSDLVEKKDISMWKEYFKRKKLADEVLELSAETGFNLNILYKMIDKVAVEKKEKYLKRGLKKINVRLIVVGIPNVGKSKLINRIVGKNSAGVANKPGHTKGKQWVRIKEGIELLDMPGILWPKFQSEEVGYNLAITGAIKDEILPVEKVACNFLEKFISFGYWEVLVQKYKLLPEDESDIMEKVLESIAIRTNMLQKGAMPNMIQAAYTVLRDYRNCKLKKIVLDNIE